MATPATTSQIWEAKLSEEYDLLPPKAREFPAGKKKKKRLKKRKIHSEIY